ncbi:MAG: hypothetical protein KAV00_17320 [Phycisphaerae bacterium]|nr:hypothetical protein [Phycisphaerae bacterium]
MSMLPLAPLRQCRCCRGYINREHCVEIVAAPGRELIDMEYCDSCEQGWETLIEIHDGCRVPQWSLLHSPRKNPVEFGKFMQRLKDEVEVPA